MEFVKVVRSEATRGSPVQQEARWYQYISTDSGVYIHCPQPLPTGLAYKFQEYTHLKHEGALTGSEMQGEMGL
jgi:hypothetical protein